MFSWLFSKPLRLGGEAPDFTLPDQDGERVTLSKLRGRNVVLVFYPGDETAVCRKQLCEFRDSWASARDKETLVFGVNPQSASSHARFRDHHSLAFPLLVDRGQKVAEAYHARGLIVKRTVYLIGKSGKIRFSSRGKPPVAEVFAAAE
ncbi:MAG TPA: peroxiredoxin [Bryobacteraceae bacterium]|nr:peroxiredoxin [Bryobacteraceae bacterium]